MNPNRPLTAEPERNERVRERSNQHGRERQGPRNGRCGRAGKNQQGDVQNDGAGKQPGDKAAKPLGRHADSLPPAETRHKTATTPQMGDGVR